MEPTDAELIAVVLNGDSSAFETLITRYQPRVFATARRYARRESEVEDIVQEVFFKAFQKLASFRGDAPFEHWLMRLAVRGVLISSSSDADFLPFRSCRCRPVCPPAG